MPPASATKRLSLCFRTLEIHDVVSEAVKEPPYNLQGRSPMPFPTIEPVQDHPCQAKASVEAFSDDLVRWQLRFSLQRPSSTLYRWQGSVLSQRSFDIFQNPPENSTIRNPLPADVSGERNVANILQIDALFPEFQPLRASGRYPPSRPFSCPRVGHRQLIILSL